MDTRYMIRIMAPPEYPWEIEAGSLDSLVELVQFYVSGCKSLLDEGYLQPGEGMPSFLTRAFEGDKDRPLNATEMAGISAQLEQVFPGATISITE